MAALGEIPKPNIRPPHDATPCYLNNQIFFRDQLQHPGPEDAAALVRFAATRVKRSFFSMSADIQVAHRAGLASSAKRCGATLWGPLGSQVRVILGGDTLRT